MALDEATQSFLAQLAASGMKPFYELDPATARETGAVLQEMYGTGPEMAEVREDLLPTWPRSPGGRSRWSWPAIPPAATWERSWPSAPGITPRRPSTCRS